MLDHVQKCFPEEACGLLAGRGDVVGSVIAVPNALRSPSRYRMEPQAQVDAMLAIEAMGHEMLAIYHSHPQGPAGPSAIDVAEAAYPEVLQLIWYRTEGSWEVRAYEVRDGAVTPAHLQVEQTGAS